MPETPAPAPDFPTHFDFAAAEPALTSAWEAAGLFKADADRTTRLGGDRDPFTVLIPPPNVTAVLHVGHGLNNTVQDVLIRWRRMAGDEALWLPGTDHAGIATQNVVEKLLAKEGKTRFDLGREAFVKRTEQFVEETGGIILQQLKAIGASADFSRTAYTLSPGLSHAVRETFVRLYEKGLVYRGHRVIHWCPRCLTSLSDEEAEFHDSEGALHHIRYALADNAAQGITIATTRPETILADVAIAVHPDDERYAALVGKEACIPLTGIRIPVIADSYVEKDFGTGALKITPAHDANDFEVGKRHGLAMPVVITPTGKIGALNSDDAHRIPSSLDGLDRFEARKAIVKQLEAAGALVKVERHANAIRRCYRCDTVVEPRLSDQWFVKMAPLAAPALQAVKDGTVRLLPEKWEKVYINWLEGIRDWNISRQLWWGHRVPVWTCANGHSQAYREDPRACASCGDTTLEQDPDVLDTWFSSWLWPISTMGWPNENPKDLKAFFPSDVLVTAPEILFFWVARMIMSGYEFEGRAPFHTVYLHGTVRDMQHRKMSKSLGNGIDPLDVVERYGADALRWTLIQGMGLGVDVMLDHTDLDKSFAPGRNFATKLWNIGRFLLLQVGDEPVGALADVEAAALRLEDRWILGRLDAAIAECDAALGPARPSGAQWPEQQRQQGMRLDAYAEAARRFVWNELADWYVEAVKPRLAQPGADREVARRVLVHVFDHGLRLLHPIMPFVTESLWQRLPSQTPGAFLAVAAWPRARAAGADAGLTFDAVREAIDAIRGLRAEYGVQPGTPIVAHVAQGSGDAAALDALLASQALVSRLARCELQRDAAPAAAAAHAVLGSKLELTLPLAGMVDLAKERARLETERAGLVKQLDALRGRLGNEKFTAKAPAAVVEAERAKEREWAARAAQLDQKIAELAS
ncbi:MAG: valine--tRNA ligase [Gemmatimonadaceae bacterium]|nr:valine--tRNA ligase [Gemmatimonadaceae bacterium]MCW5827398.1 valine--tRNA ligase [Gemmatimonadaceae bacterium]